MKSSDVVGDLAALEAAFAALEQGITIHDRDGRIVVCNPAAARIAGLPLDKMLGTRRPDYAHEVRDQSGDIVTEGLSGVLRALRTGESEVGRLVEVRPNDGGGSRWLRVNCQPLFSETNEEPWGVVASVVEVESPGAAWASTIDAKVSSAHESTGLAHEITEALERHAPADAAITRTRDEDAQAAEIQNLRTEITELAQTLDDALKER